MQTAIFKDNFNQPFGSIHFSSDFFCFNTHPRAETNKKQMGDMHYHAITAQP